MLASLQVGLLGSYSEAGRMVRDGGSMRHALWCRLRLEAWKLRTNSTYDYVCTTYEGVRVCA